MKMKKNANCPSCSIQVDIGKNRHPYQRFRCPGCETFLEIINIDPPVLDWAFRDREEFYDNLDFVVWSFR